MASIKTTKHGTHEVQVAIKGVRESRSFVTKAEARAWAAMRETELRTQARTGIAMDKTCADAFIRYQEEVSPKKRGADWEAARLTALREMPLAKVKLSDLNSTHIAKHRDMRLQSVKPATVNREMNLLSHCFNVARKEWRWIQVSPTSGVTRPKEPPPRCRRISADEIERMCWALGFVEGELAQSKSQCIGVAFLFAIETAMRLGEICALQRGDRSKDKTASYLKSPNLAHLGMTKNGDGRDVPLSGRAVELLKLLPMTGALYFGLESKRVDPLFRRARLRAGIEDLHFHDTRHEAISRMVRDKKIQVTTLARLVGHRNINELLTYYNPTEGELEELAKTL